MSDCKFVGNLVIRGRIKCVTGLTIGSTDEMSMVGGADKQVIKDREGVPYIPGSSLKGKMRSLTEWSMGKVQLSGEPHTLGKPHVCLDQAKAISCPVCLVFGKPAGEKLMIGPSRLVVRDATVTDKAMEKVTAGSAVELKTENVINRLRGAAEHPRTFERVSRGMDFNLEMVYSVYDLGSGPKTDFDNAAVVFKAMRLLEESYLGGSGSRGYGKVKFEDLEFTWRPLSSLGGAEPPARKVESLDKAEETLKELIGAK